MGGLRAAIRLPLRRPGFIAAIVATLAIALGSSAAIFSLLNAIILRPLPFPAADRIVAVTAIVGGDDGRLSLREYRDLSKDTRTFEAWGAYYPSQYNVTGGGPPEALTCTIGTSTMFAVLGVKPLLGEIWPESLDRAAVDRYLALQFLTRCKAEPQKFPRLRFRHGTLGFIDL